jgi:hypothetical protein
MTFQELLADKIFDLPLIQKKAGGFKEFIEKFLNDFLEKVEALDDNQIQLDTFSVDIEFVKSTQRKIVKGLIECIKNYYDGYPQNAYKKINMVLRNDLKDLYAIIKQKTYEVNESFYRIRLSDKNFTFDKSELFHIPFQYRNKVSTQRYSIPGFPSLYLGRTVYICWEELNRPSIDKIQVVRLKNKKIINCLDLTPPLNDCKNLDELYKFFMTFPLIACCSVKVFDSTDTFKPEYIIPQLLLQWVRNNDILDGIRYKSTHINSEVYKENSELINIVMPVKKTKNIGLCEELLSTFESTEVISWNIYQFAIGGQLFLYNDKDAEIVDKKIPHLELIKGRKYPYFYSNLGRLEHYLEFMETTKIM